MLWSSSTQHYAFLSFRFLFKFFFKQIKDVHAVSNQLVMDKTMLKGVIINPCVPARYNHHVEGLGIVPLTSSPALVPFLKLRSWLSSVLPGLLELAPAALMHNLLTSIIFPLECGQSSSIGVFEGRAAVISLPSSLGLTAGGNSSISSSVSEEEEYLNNTQTRHFLKAMSRSKVGFGKCERHGI